MLHTRKIRRLAALVVGLAAVAFVPLAAQPASAATLPDCTTTTQFIKGGVHFTLPTTASGSLNCNLFNEGSDNPADVVAVKSLQNDLNLCYGPGSSLPGHIQLFKPALDPDGGYGPLTEGAVRAVQTHYHPPLNVDGQFGPLTRAQINFPVDDNGLRCERFGS